MGDPVPLSLPKPSASGGELEFSLTVGGLFPPESYSVFSITGATTVTYQVLYFLCTPDGVTISQGIPYLTTTSNAAWGASWNSQIIPSGFYKFAVIPSNIPEYQGPIIEPSPLSDLVEVTSPISGAATPEALDTAINAALSKDTMPNIAELVSSNPVVTTGTTSDAEIVSKTIEKLAGAIVDPSRLQQITEKLSATKTPADALAGALVQEVKGNISPATTTVAMKASVEQTNVFSPSTALNFLQASLLFGSAAAMGKTSTATPPKPKATANIPAGEEYIIDVSNGYVKDSSGEYTILIRDMTQLFVAEHDVSYNLTVNHYISANLISQTGVIRRTTSNLYFQFGTGSVKTLSLTTGYFVLSKIKFMASMFGVTGLNGSPAILATPTGVQAVAGDSQVTISWNAVTTDSDGLALLSNEDVNGYHVIYTVDGAEVTVSSASSPCIITGLQNNVTYSFRVAAVTTGNNYFDSEESSAVSATPVAPGGGVVCFLGNAPVLTPSGYKRIDSLAVGDMVRTADGRDVAIQRVKHQRVVAPSAAVNPYVIPAGQFGATQALAISPRHAVAVPGRGMVEARELGLRQLSMKAAFDYYNLELPEWDNMVVAGVEVESLAPKKRVVMTAAQFRELVGGRSVDLARLARMATVRADGSVDVTLTRKARRM